MPEVWFSPSFQITTSVWKILFSYKEWKSKSRSLEQNKYPKLILLPCITRLYIDCRIMLSIYLCLLAMTVLSLSWLTTRKKLHPLSRSPETFLEKNCRSWSLFIGWPVTRSSERILSLLVLLRPLLEESEFHVKVIFSISNICNLRLSLITNPFVSISKLYT